ncbi:hypothetical protein WR25_03215 [Diploscapter pachys]|uniref:Uncharacterized protein n=1 Tax=Diploscapter pachys TaxID=2018661 RepID=A0A2A2KYR1_9BILA|nr:hypothetical protein WR25_03215 [Diploscapter pachys]
MASILGQTFECRTYLFSSGSCPYFIINFPNLLMNNGEFLSSFSILIRKAPYSENYVTSSSTKLIDFFIVIFPDSYHYHIRYKISGNSKMANQPRLENPMYSKIAGNNWALDAGNLAVHSASYDQPGNSNIYDSPPAYDNPPTSNVYNSAPQPQLAATTPQNAINVEAGGPKKNLVFTDRSLRHAFIRKVFLLVTIMLIIIAVMCSIPFYTEGLRNFAQTNIPFLVVPICVYLVTAILLSCVQPLRRTYPINLIMLLIFTVATGCMLMSICSCYNVVSVLICMIATLGVSAAIFLFATQTKWDFTSLIGIAYLLGISLLMFGINAILFAVVFNFEWPLIIYGWLSSILIIFYMMIDIQLIMGGRRFELSEEEYVLAALMLFLDIVNIFLTLLRIFGRK